MWSDDERGKQGVEGGGKVGERRAVGGAVGEATVDEPPQLGGTAGGRRQPRSRRTQLALPHHVVVGQSPQRQLAQREHLQRSQHTHADICKCKCQC